MIRRGLALLGALAAFVVGRVLRIRRAHAVRAMRRAGVEDPEATVTAMYRNLGRGLAELFALPPELPLEIVNEATLSAALAPGRGAVLCVAHTGNWDYVACAAAARRPLTVVTKHLSVGVLDRVWQRIRTRRGVRLVAAGSAARAAQRALARGECVAMMIDQAPERTRGTTVAPFLNAPARVDLAPALLALRAGAPLVTVFPRRRADGRHQAVVGVVHTPPPRARSASERAPLHAQPARARSASEGAPLHTQPARARSASEGAPLHAQPARARSASEGAPLHTQPARARREWAVRTLHDVTAELDAFVRANPDQWLWMHRRWKDAPDPAAPLGATPADAT
ncbi:MAG: hypothetical protein H6717_25865 [Polyangiaceae bacterium]|nr:hypothetical protein [Polyangiaceae bacterium]